MSISEKTMTPGEEFEVRHPMARPKLQTVVKGVSRTHQSFYEETRIQNIYERFTRTGSLGFEERKARQQFGDVSGLNKDLTELHVLHSQVYEKIDQAAARVDEEKAAARKKAEDASAPQGGTSQEPSSAPVAREPVPTPAPDGGKGS